MQGNNRSIIVNQCLVVLVSSLTAAIGLNYFLIPAQVLSSGLSGVAQIINRLLQNYWEIGLNIGMLLLILNLPIFLIGFLKLGKEATVWSFITVAATSAVIAWLPQGRLTENVLMNALVGGILLGISAGTTLRMGFTTGGLDILSLLLAKSTGKSVGNFIFLLNALIVIVAGVLFDWESALYTMLSIFVMSQTINGIHNNQQKVTIFIITNYGDLLVNNFRENTLRGVTHWSSRGGFTGENREMIMIVANRYEVIAIQQQVKRIDTGAFINIVETQETFGNFISEDEQEYYKKSKKIQIVE